MIMSLQTSSRSVQSAEQLLMSCTCVCRSLAHAGTFAHAVTRAYTNETTTNEKSTLLPTLIHHKAFVTSVPRSLKMVT
eukprot:1162132-Pelagomonas_calceolata.AAC.1